jgi:hypothetical protein
VRLTARSRLTRRRIIDLLEPFQSFDYFHPEQHGSASIKTVLPVLTGHSNRDLEIQEGGQASLEYLRVHFGDVPESRQSPQPGVCRNLKSCSNAANVVFNGSGRN